MNKWSRIKDKIYQEKLDEVNVIFDTVSENINNLKIPRSAWVTPLAEWATIQISDKNSPKLSLQEYAHFKKFINDFGDSLAIRNNEKEQVVKEFRSFFLEDYQEALERKENEIKLEVAAEIIEEKQFPLEVFAEWYIEHWSLPQEKFNEELGSFWGDVSRGALKGAGYGALGGGAVGSFAGAGLGGLAGGLAGGIWGGGKHLLQQVWNYRQTQRNFEETKDKALDSLKRLKELSKGFDMHPNFITSLDNIINQLGTVKAYRIAPSGVSRHATEEPTEPTDQEAVPGKPAEAEKPIPKTRPAPPPEKPVEKPTVAEKPKPAVSEPPARKPARTVDDHETDRQAALRDALGGGEPPKEGPPVEKEPVYHKMEDERDIIDTYTRAKEKDREKLVDLGNALIVVGKIISNPMTKEPELIDEDIPLSEDQFKYLSDLYNKPYEREANDEDAIKAAELYVNHLIKQRDQGALAKPGTPKVDIEAGEPFTKQEEALSYLEINKRELLSMEKNDFTKAIKDQELEQLIEDLEIGDPETGTRLLALKKLRDKLIETTPESNFSFGRLFDEETLQGQLNILPVKERIEHIKFLLKA